MRLEWSFEEAFWINKLKVIKYDEIVKKSYNKSQPRGWLNKIISINKSGFHVKQESTLFSVNFIKAILLLELVRSAINFFKPVSIFIVWRG
jgi:hypothetical protein